MSNNDSNFDDGRGIIAFINSKNSGETVCGGLVILLLVFLGAFGAIAYIGGAMVDNAANGRAEKLRDSLGNYVTGLRFDVTTFATKREFSDELTINDALNLGGVPAQPKLLYVVAKLDSPLEMQLREGRETLDEIFGKIHYSLAPLDDELPDYVLAKTSDEINVIAVQFDASRVDGRYTDGSDGIRLTSRIFIISMPSKSVVATYEFTGSSPDKQVGGAAGPFTSRTGSSPSRAQIAKWIRGFLMTKGGG